MLLKQGGYDIATARPVLFFHPFYVVSILQADPAAWLEAPLKLAVIEQPEGSTTLRWADPAIAFSRYGNAKLAALGR